MADNYSIFLLYRERTNSKWFIIVLRDLRYEFNLKKLKLKLQKP